MGNSEPIYCTCRLSSDLSCSRSRWSEHPPVAVAAVAAAAVAHASVAGAHTAVAHAAVAGAHAVVAGAPQLGQQWTSFQCRISS